MTRYTYGVTEKGKKLGEAHHNAKLSDEDVERIRNLYEEGLVSYQWLAKKFGVSKATIADICTYRKRATTPESYRTVKRADMKRKPPVSKFLEEDHYLVEDMDDGFSLSEELGMSDYRTQRLIDDMD